MINELKLILFNKKDILIAKLREIVYEKEKEDIKIKRRNIKISKINLDNSNVNFEAKIIIKKKVIVKSYSLPLSDIYTNQWQKVSLKCLG